LVETLVEDLAALIAAVPSGRDKPEVAVTA
jgi:hypothetical protein